MRLQPAGNRVVIWRHHTGVGLRSWDRRAGSKGVLVTDPERKQVLVVEDDDSIATLVTRVLTRSLLDVCHVSSAEGALEHLRTRSWDCVIADVRLPGMSGLDLTRWLRSEGQDLPVVVMTAQVAPPMEDDARRAGADAFLRKPFTPTSLRAEVTRMLQPCDDDGARRQP